VARRRKKAKKLRVKLVRSPIGYARDQRWTARLLGLRKLHQEVVIEDRPELRGMVNKIIHLVQVQEVEE